MSSANELKSNMVAQIEDCKQDVTTVEEKHAAAADYSGAVAKVDEREIALVRKLDLRIVPTLWAMYFLNYLVSSIEYVPYCETTIASMMAL
jgi:hypothetical protein